MSPIHKYFLSERLQCSAGIILALAFILLAFWLRANTNTDFYRGLFYPFIIIPFLLLLICTAVVIRTGKDITRVDQLYRSGSDQVRSVEIPRMEKVMRNFKRIKLIELSLLALGTLIFVAYFRQSLVAGIGMGLIIQSLIMYAIDHFAEARGRIYLDFLNSV